MNHVMGLRIGALSNKGGKYTHVSLIPLVITKQLKKKVEVIHKLWEVKEHLCSVPSLPWRQENKSLEMLQ